MAKIPLSIEGGALAQYLEEISRHNPLTREEEQEVFACIQEGDEDAKTHLIQANLRFVVTIAKEYTHLGMSLSDLIGEGNLGLIKAVDRFDPTRGFKFISYAVWWIRHAMRSALADRGRLIRLPQNQGQMLHQIYQASLRLEQETGYRPTSAEIAGELEMSPEQVDRVLSLGRHPRSLDAPAGQDDDDRRLGDLIDGGEPSPEEDTTDNVLRETIQGMLGTLDAREAEIIRLYYGIEGGEPMTLEEIAQRYDLTRERIRQIREHALSRLRHPSRSRPLKEFWEN